VQTTRWTCSGQRDPTVWSARKRRDVGTPGRNGVPARSPYKSEIVWLASWPRYRAPCNRCIWLRWKSPVVQGIDRPLPPWRPIFFLWISCLEWQREGEQAVSAFPPVGLSWKGHAIHMRPFFLSAAYCPRNPHGADYHRTRMMIPSSCSARGLGIGRLAIAWWPFFLQCVDCIKLSGTLTSMPGHTSLIPSGIKKTRRGSFELTYHCNTCGTRWRRTMRAFGLGRAPHVWTAAWNAPPAKNSFDEPTTKPAHARLIAESVGVFLRRLPPTLRRQLDVIGLSHRYPFGPHASSPIGVAASYRRSQTPIMLSPSNTVGPPHCFALPWGYQAARAVCDRLYRFAGH